jgi:threonine dehydrogenase-like Zn-dependent dehydrogenase
MILPATMKFGLYFGSSDVRIGERPIPAIGPTEVLVRVATCGICGSDTMEWYREPAIRRLGGINTGHEIAGERRRGPSFSVHGMHALPGRQRDRL